MEIRHPAKKGTDIPDSKPSLLRFFRNIHLHQRRHYQPVLIGTAFHFLGQFGPVEGLEQPYFLYYIFNFVGLQPANPM